MGGGRPSGTVTFLFTDLEGSTRNWEARPDAMSSALAEHDGIMRSSVEAHDGFVFGTAGDSFSAAFHRPEDGAAAALEIQRRLAGETTDPALVRSRMGLHVGTADERDGDYFGPAVNRAARIMSVGHGGQTVVSSAFAELYPDDDLVDLGRHGLKDLDTPEHLWQIGGGSFPDLRSVEGYRHNLPAPRTELIGRDEQIESLAHVLNEHRLVSLLGIGGTGKTRLAQAVGLEVLHRFPDGVWFVDLVPVSSSRGVVEAIGSATGLKIVGADLLAGLADVLSDRHLLLVLDNSEHITDEVADVVDELLERAVSPRVLVTSREPLQLADEFHVQVPPLVVAADERSPAMTMFRAAAARFGAEVPSDQLDLAAKILHELDGLPLSIELAAAQLRQLTLAELAGRLEQRFALLQERRGGRRRRQASLLAVLEETWQGLNDDERTFLLHVAAFPSMFELRDAEELLAGRVAGVPTRISADLVDRGLLVGRQDGRLFLLETVKLFARRRWDDDDPDEYLERHTQWLFGRVRAHGPDVHLNSLHFSQWMNERHDDRRLVEDRLLEAERLDDLAELFRASWLAAWNQSNSSALVMLNRLERMITTRQLSEAQSAAVHLVGSAAAMPARRPEWFVRGSAVAIDSYRRSPGYEPLSMALVVGSFMRSFGDLPGALELLDEARAAARTAGARRCEGLTLAYRALLLSVHGDRGEALEVVQETERNFGGPLDQVWGITESARFVIHLFDDPPRARNCWGGNRSHVELGFVALANSWAAAADGDIRAALSALSEAEVSLRAGGGDDGLPDLLLAPAIGAWRLGDSPRATRWATAIHRADRQTQSFNATGAFRQLRDRVGLLDENPLETISIQEIYREARAWLNEQVTGP